MAQPTYEQGQLQLQIYDLRREAKLRQARDWFFQNYQAETFDDAMRIAAPGTENGTLAMMVWVTHLANGSFSEFSSSLYTTVSPVCFSW